MSSRRSGLTRRRPTQLVGALLLTISSTLVMGVGVAAADTPADPPTALTATLTGTGANLSWTQPANTGTQGSLSATITGYNVYFGASGAETLASCSPTTPPCTVSGLTPGTTYYYYVTTLNSASLESVSSGESSFLFEAPQATLVLTPLTGPSGTSLALNTTGGSGTGAVTFAVTGGTATNCVINGTGPTR